MVEEWRDIVGYEGKYQVSNLGNVRSIDHIVVCRGKHGAIVHRHVKGKLLKQQLNLQGYYIVGLQPLDKSKSKETLVSRMVAKAFIPNPDNLPCVNHKDENPKNNRVDNLEWCTQEYNNQYGTIRERHRQMMLGKKRGPHSEETKQKIRNSLLGHEVSKETRDKISEAGKGRTPWNKGLRRQKEMGG